MYEKVCKNKNVVLLPIAARSCHLAFLGDKQSEKETSRGAGVRAMKSQESENAPAQQRAHLHTCLRDMVSPSPHLWGTFVLDVLSSADCPPHFRANTSSASVATAEDPKSVLGFCSEVCESSHVNFSHSSAFSLYVKEFLGMMQLSILSSFFLYFYNSILLYPVGH